MKSIGVGLVLLAVLFFAAGIIKRLPNGSEWSPSHVQRGN